MAVRLRRWLSVPHMRRCGAGLSALIALAALLELAAGAAVDHLVGFSRVRSVLGDVQWAWLVVLVGALAVSVTGDHFAYRGIFHVEEGPECPDGNARGRGGRLRRSFRSRPRCPGPARAGGGRAGAREARARAVGLAGLEQGVLAIGGCGAAIAILASGFARPPGDARSVVVPLLPGFLVAFGCRALP